jgi:hypothetical protein
VRLVFNAHRISFPCTVLAGFPSLRLLSFEAVDAAGNFVPNADLEGFNEAYASCGLFELTK